ncbi:uncharacterized protein LOC105254791 isoform X3 [Camponotus floridanus]|uniref:uncharacterized protein LOC105254791 isoform X3 n=1 Tax=Camponotus floridanus TaxID=104421 RepID=UPI00059C43BA|nr:uncharacterized protein LOC105254791 isoform X3 [Camponotus floridanus]
MGNYMTKLFRTNEGQKESDELQTVKQQVAADDNMCTPTLKKLATQDDSMCTPTLPDKRILCDPRSISAGIARTPIETIIQDNSMCTSTLPEKRVLCDPRSISVGVSRTPIEVNYTPIPMTKRAPSAIPEYLQKKKYLETNMDIVMPPLTPKKCFIKLTDGDQGSESDGTQDYLTPNINAEKDPKHVTPIDNDRYEILGLDPRSPAADFDRTPLLKPKSLALIKVRSQETLHRRGSYESDIYKPTKSHQEINTSLNIPKIQLLSNVISGTSKTLDMEEQDESHIFCTPQQSDSDSSVFENEEEVTVIKNLKCKNEEEKSSISLVEQITATDKNKDDTNIKNDCEDIEHDMETIHIKDDESEVWHDSVSSEEDIAGKKEKENIIQKLPQKKAREDIIIMFDECATISTLPKPIKIEGDCQKKGDIARRKKNAKIGDTVTSNEKKTLNLENKMNRTPFGNRSNNDQVQRINSPQYLLRNKTASTKIQQENTPPCKMYNAKTKNHHWDPNTTVFI